MDTTPNEHPQGAFVDLSRLNCEIVLLEDPQREPMATYRATCTDMETGRFVGSFVLPAALDGRPPSLSLADIAGLIGGYRLASIFVEIESERLARLNRRAADRRRSRERAWLRRVPRRILADLELERTSVPDLQGRMSS